MQDAAILGGTFFSAYALLFILKARGAIRKNQRYRFTMLESPLLNGQTIWPWAMIGIGALFGALGAYCWLQLVLV